MTALILVAVYDLRHADLSVPLQYTVHKDMMLHLIAMKTIRETGWIHVNERMGAPGFMDIYDYSTLDALGWLMLKGLMLPTGNPAAGINLFFLLGFFVNGWACLFVLRRFGISGPIALGAGSLFAFLPYHFYRGPWHMSLSFYAVVPPAVMLCLWICERGPPSSSGIAGGVGAARSRGRWGRSRSRLTALLSIYYAWFMGFLLVTSGLVAWLRRPRLVPPWDACICLVVSWPRWRPRSPPSSPTGRSTPKAPNAVQRSPGQSQMWGLTVPELVMPTVGHRIPKLRIVESRRSIGQGADPSSPRMDTRMSINEKYFNALGVVGSSGFFFLLLILLAGGARWVSRFEPVSDLAKLNIASVLLGSGFATTSSRSSSPRSGPTTELRSTSHSSRSSAPP